MKKLVFYIILLSYKLLAQPDFLIDIFPLNKGNQYNYRYEYSDTTYWVSVLEHIQNDSGIITFKLLDSTVDSNNIDWVVEQNINLIRHYITLDVDSLYHVQIKNNFILHESLDGNHLLTCEPPTWDSTNVWGIVGIWKFPVHKPNNLIIPIYRFQETSDLFICNNFPSFLDSLWFDKRGLYKRVYYGEYSGNHRIYQHQQSILESITGITENQNYSLPEKFQISQNYPNPFNPSTKINFTIPQDVKRETSNVKLIVYDILGREVKTLLNKPMLPGNYEVEFNGSDLPSGVYFYRLISGEILQTQKMILIK